jgi:hypothetical protein
MEIKEEYNFDGLKSECWGGALDTLEKVEKAGKENDLLSFMETCIFYDDLPTITDVNDFLAFDEDFILQSLGITEEEEN